MKTKTPEARRFYVLLHIARGQAPGTCGLGKGIWDFMPHENIHTRKFHDRHDQSYWTGRKEAEGWVRENPRQQCYFLGMHMHTHNTANSMTDTKKEEWERRGEAIFPFFFRFTIMIDDMTLRL